MTSATLLVENCVRKAGLLAEHGLSWWIESEGRKILFDTGQGMVLRHNAKCLGVDLALADAIVLSHGHYDHVGGLAAALALAPRATLWLHPAACDRKFSRQPDGKARRISTDFMEARDFGAERRVRWIEGPTEVVPGWWVTGPVPRVASFEDVGGAFYLDEELKSPDPILDDLALYHPTTEGTIVLFGCAHAGVVNTLEHIAAQPGVTSFAGLYGGLHLLQASPARMDKTIEALRRWAPTRLGFCHCTGWRAGHRLVHEFPEICEEMQVGRRLEWPTPKP